MEKVNDDDYKESAFKTMFNIVAKLIQKMQSKKLSRVLNLFKDIFF